MSAPTTTTDRAVRVERHGRVGVVVLDKPERRNPLNTSPTGSEQQIAEALEELERDDEIHVVVITGSGPAFSAGADMKSVGGQSYSQDEIIERAISEPNTPDEGKSWALWNVLDRYEKPLIAAVNGHAVGAGWEVALWCDIVIADEQARFALTQINLGYLPVFASLFLTRTAGLYKTAKLAYTAEFIDAATAAEMGAVTEVVPAGTSLDRALELAAEIAVRPRLVLKMVRLALKRGFAQMGEWRANQRDFVLMGLSDISKSTRKDFVGEFTARPSNGSSTA